MAMAAVYADLRTFNASLVSSQESAHPCNKGK